MAEAQRRVDEPRIAFVSDTLTELGVAPDRARVLATPTNEIDVA